MNQLQLADVLYLHINTHTWCSLHQQYINAQNVLYIDNSDTESNLKSVVTINACSYINSFYFYQAFTIKK